MPRVTQHTASGRGKTYTCTGCGQPIEAGQAYYRWVRRIGPKAGYRRHVACGRPRPTELSGRKTAQVEEAVLDYTAPEVDYPTEITDVTEETPVEDRPLMVSLDIDLTDAVEDVASVAESVADEYEEGVYNMPEQLQYAPTGEAMTQVAEELREWAQNLRDAATDQVDVDIEPTDEFLDWQVAANEAVETAWQERVDEIDSLMGDMPEYQG